MDAVLCEYENFLINPTSQTYKKFQSNSVSPRLCRVAPCNNSSTYGHYHPRKRQTSSHRRQCRNEQDQMLSIMKNTLHSAGNDSDNVLYEYPRFARNSYKKESYWGDDQMVTGVIKAANVDCETVEKCMQHKKERLLKSEPWSPRQCVEKTNKLNANERYRLEEHKDDEYTRGRLRFDLSKHSSTKKIDLDEDIEHDKSKQGRKKTNFSTNKLSILKCRSQSLSRNKNVEDLSKQKVSTIDRNDYSKETDLSKEVEDRSMYKSCQRSTARQDSPCSPGKESTSNTDESRDDMYCELVVKDEEQDPLHKKNIHAGGDLDLDLDLHTIKSNIIDLIDRVISKTFTTSSGQQKNAESNRELTEQGFSIEIIRALRGDYCELFTEDLLSNYRIPADRIKRLKNLRWKHMQHIQNEFNKLCNLQKFLDQYSPRQSLSAFQFNSNAVEQRVEDRQQEQEQEEQGEQPNLGTIS
ncbi:PREDICTED: uncharacterized protein LOC108552526 [Eufriesea mexicana]|uniref:uncharacterized protein LOC108552526 n=1 Tax=Eufriesea mexicana TaxID=516756 RepID=UPI00083C714C|nr:PREDICTED: uncharacterized protein LOC108552526 [Eufriesea mexicana]